jgi:hypothetical protein
MGSRFRGNDVLWLTRQSGPLAVCERYACAQERTLHPDHSTDFTIVSITFFASPNTIIVFGW